MKKLLFFVTILLVSLPILGQTGSSAADNLYSKYQELDEKYQKNYAEKNYSQTESLLNEMIDLIDNIKLSDEEIEEYQSVLNILKGYTYYNLACTYSLKNQKEEAINAFEKAIEFDYADYSHAKSDRDFDNIHKEEKFIALVEKIKQFSKLSILQNAGAYQKENTDSLPKFTYQSAENYNLKEVKKYFNLDSIAGSGDEISKIINLMFFVTKAIKYDGSNWALCEFDAIDFYNYHKATGKGINCRHKAMTLNEIYLAMGFKSRYVTCMPKDEKDPDCHVINCVYSETLGKWLWMDSSHGIYVTDENGNLLSISEVRERLINEQPLQLNKETEKTKEWYLDSYMAKNLYWLNCANVSKFNTESRYRWRDGDVQYIVLLPLGYGEENSYVNGNLVTHDPNYFWQLPIAN